MAHLIDKVAERALETYPIVISQHSDNCKEYDSNESARLTFIEGYHQAEKDLELGWEDIQNIRNIIAEMMTESYTRNSSWSTHEEFSKEVLKRFKDLKEK